MSIEDPVTLGELSRRIDNMEHRFEQAFTKLGQSIDSLRFVNLDQYRAERDADRHRIAELEDQNTWMIRAVVTAILFPLIVAAIAAIILGGGP